MPFSRSQYDGWVRKFVADNYRPEQAIIDIGAGAGKYGLLLHDRFPLIDALEAEPSYAETYGLKMNYRKVHVSDALAFGYAQGGYRLAILGDMLPCMPAAAAQALLAKLAAARIDALVLVPYDLDQGAWHGYETERFRQPGMTAAIMAERYPKLRKLAEDPKGGVYFSEAK